ncbi:hypothetical protein SISNIDRAFT_453667 [Sistotremastrum niveocremeum HHB9708]|uniref:Protein CASP n=1 Tax=Sistotremastrum niveocremeum HHB9708 TaxID=1314777 RepID=A0A164V9V6_9AGAM|nr:hypothetical protein SISNIDRAFT_453667 [Sistotremastrum niveocremeum HHB9708]
MTCLEQPRTLMVAEDGSKIRCAKISSMSSEHSFADALALWKEINLTDLQKTLDAQGIELVENQKESVVGRKGLADRTKEFKKIPDEEKLNAIKGLLKAYQTEIDSLTRRCKFSENAFLSVYKVFAEAPDPYPLLELAVDQTVKVSQVSSLESEIARLREENAELKKKADAQSSTEKERKKAEKRVETLEEKMEVMIAERVAVKENEMHATYDERLMNYQEREKDFIRQVELAKSQLRDLRTSNESKDAKLLNHSERQDQETVARLAELDLIVADLERANTRVAAVERRNEILRAELEASRAGIDTAAVERIKTFESTIESLENSQEKLSRALDNQRDIAADAERQLTRKIEALERDVSSKASEIENLKRKISRFSDYDEIKRELEIMKFVEFAGADINDSEDDIDGDQNQDDGLRLPNPNSSKQSDGQNKSLEVLLASKNKRMLDELTKFRVLHGELEASLTRISAELEEHKAELQKQKELNEKLELDLLQVHKSSTPPDSNGELNLLGGRGTPDVSSTRSPGEDDRTLNHSPIPFTSSAETSILPIVTSQRDRFRQRNAELEEQLRKQLAVISELRAESKTLQGDNLKLYEKVRYMQSYRDDGAGPSKVALDALNIGSGDDLGKYKSRYEEAMNPFAAFQSREASRAVQALNPVEGAVLALTRHILGSRRARITFICYATALHVLVIFTTYESALGSDRSKAIPYGN